MAATAVIAGSLVGNVDPNIVDGGPATVLKSAIGDDPEALRKLGGTYTFQVEANTNTDDAATVLNLNVPGTGMTGVSWVGADSLRRITTKAWWRNVAGTSFGYSEKVDVVRGSAAGTTPTLSANEPALTGGQAESNADHSYRVRTGLLVTTQTTPLYPKAGVAISGALAVVRVVGPQAGTDLRWLVNVVVEPLAIVPVAVT